MSNHHHEQPDTPPPPPPPPNGASKPIAATWSVGRRVALTGAVVGVAGSLLPWATVQALLASYSVDGMRGDGQLTILLFGVAGVVLLASPQRAMSVIVLVLSSIAILIAGNGIVNVSNLAIQTESESSLIQISPGIGIYLCVLGGVVSIIGASIDLSK